MLTEKDIITRVAEKGVWNLLTSEDAEEREGVLAFLGLIVHHANPNISRVAPDVVRYLESRRITLADQVLLGAALLDSAATTAAKEILKNLKEES
ncbi:MAG: hypothetical protein QW518_04045 [Thermofilaceae archaeon]